MFLCSENIKGLTSFRFANLHRGQLQGIASPTFGCQLKSMSWIKDSLNRLLNAGAELDVDFINENDSVANPDPTPRIASIYKSRLAKVVLAECWMDAV